MCFATKDSLCSGVLSRLTLSTMGQAVNKMVFQPPTPSYTIEEKEGENVDGWIFLNTKKGSRIVAKHIDFGFDTTILFSHGNAEGLCCFLLSCISLCD